MLLNSVIRKKLLKESVVYRRTALFQANLDGRHRTQITQDRERETRSRYPQGTRGGILTKAAVRTTWVESPFTYPSDLSSGQLRLQEMKVGESHVPKRQCI